MLINYFLKSCGHLIALQLVTLDVSLAVCQLGVGWVLAQDCAAFVCAGEENRLLFFIDVVP